MQNFHKNPLFNNEMLPVDIVLHPSWWYHNEGMTFDEDFFFHPKKRVESERKMERILYERWGKYGFGHDHDHDIPQVGAVHLAAGFLLSAMLGCDVDYKEDAAPQVIEAHLETLDIHQEEAFRSPAFTQFERLTDDLKTRYGYVKGDVNWSGILNVAMDLRGQQVFMDIFDTPRQIHTFFGEIASVIEKFVTRVEKATGTTSISVNRNVRNIPAPVYLHSECSHTMISVKDYETYLLPFDADWSQRHRPYGIHYCGADPHRYAEAFATLPYLDFLDVGWGGDLKLLRTHLPHTFLNIRLSPVDIIHQRVEEIRETIIKCVKDSGNPWLTGVCCINMDHQVSDEKISAIFESVAQLRQEYADNTLRH